MAEVILLVRLQNHSNYDKKPRQRRNILTENLQYLGREPTEKLSYYIQLRYVIQRPCRKKTAQRQPNSKPMLEAVATVEAASIFS